MVENAEASLLGWTLEKCGHIALQEGGFVHTKSGVGLGESWLGVFVAVFRSKTLPLRGFLTVPVERLDLEPALLAFNLEEAKRVLNILKGVRGPMFGLVCRIERVYGSLTARAERWVQDEQLYNQLKSLHEAASDGWEPPSLLPPAPKKNAGVNHPLKGKAFHLWEDDIPNYQGVILDVFASSDGDLVLVETQDWLVGTHSTCCLWPLARLVSPADGLRASFYDTWEERNAFYETWAANNPGRAKGA